MDGIAWADLDAAEQRTLSMLRDGVPTVLCDPVAVVTLQRIGFLIGRRLTSKGEKLFPASVLHESACAYRKSNPAILMVQSFQDRTADNTSDCLSGA